MDCLADTGLGLGGLIALAVVGVIAGLAVFLFVRSGPRRRGAAVGLLLLLAVGVAGSLGAPPARAAQGGGCVAGVAPAAASTTPGTNDPPAPAPVPTTTATPGPSTTVTAAPTPTPTRTPDVPITATPPPDSPVIDLSIAATVAPPSVPSNVATPVAVSVVVDNIRAAASSGPVTVKIPKLVGAEAGGLIVSGFNWTVDDLSDPANHVLTYGLAIPGFGHSSTLVMGYPGWTVRDTLVVPAMIVTGSAGDTDPANNSTSVTVRIS